ncbi:MAG: thiamine pyrophosphate-dependent enzyme, partial [Pyrinomonadaceae bacterium]
MPKTAAATKKKTATAAKKVSNPVASRSSGNPAKANGHHPSEADIVELAKQEFQKRRRSQLESIKNTDKKLLREMLYQMVLGRRFEEKCAEVYRMGKIGGFCHLYIGQEAIGIGSMMALKPSDMVLTSYRDHVQAMVKGISPEAVMA